MSVRRCTAHLAPETVPILFSATCSCYDCNIQVGELAACAVVCVSSETSIEEVPGGFTRCHCHLQEQLHRAALHWEISPVITDNTKVRVSAAHLARELQYYTKLQKNVVF